MDTLKFIAAAFLALILIGMVNGFFSNNGSYDQDDFCHTSTSLC